MTRPGGLRRSGQVYQDLGLPAEWGHRPELAHEGKPFQPSPFRESFWNGLPELQLQRTQTTILNHLKDHRIFRFPDSRYSQRLFSGADMDTLAPRWCGRRQRATPSSSWSGGRLRRPPAPKFPREGEPAVGRTLPPPALCTDNAAMVAQPVSLLKKGSEEEPFPEIACFTLAAKKPSSPPQRRRTQRSNNFIQRQNPRQHLFSFVSLHLNSSLGLSISALNFSTIFGIMARLRNLQILPQKGLGQHFVIDTSILSGSSG